MRGNELVAHGHNLVGTQLSAGDGIHHGGMVDQLTLAGVGSFDGEHLRIDVGGVHGSQLQRQVTDIGGGHAAGIDQAGHFDAGVFGEVRDHAVVDDVAADLVGIFCRMFL